MNKYSKKILKFLNKESPKLYSEYELAQMYKIDKHYISETFKDLVDNKLISKECIAKSNGISVSGENYYRSTLKGKSYFKSNFIVHLNKFLYSCLNSILCPIIVSVITTLITIWLSGLFVTE